MKKNNRLEKKQDKVLVVEPRKKVLNHTEVKVEQKDIHVRVIFDYPTIEGMIYKGTKIKVSESDFNNLEYSQKIKGRTDVGKIVWVPIKLIEKI